MTTLCRLVGGYEHYRETCCTVHVTPKEAIFPATLAPIQQAILLQNYNIQLMTVLAEEDSLDLKMVMASFKILSKNI
jgi:hypothetical protein